MEGFEVAVVDDDCPEMTEDEIRVMKLVLSHPRTRGGSKVAMYYQGMEEQRLKSLRNIMGTMSLSLDQAMEALGIPNEEYAKYAEVV